MSSSSGSSSEETPRTVGGGKGGLGLVYDERMCAHKDTHNPFHPEQPARITSIYKALESAGIVDRCERVEARDATPAELGSVHTEEHIANMCTVSSKKLKMGKRAEFARASVYINEGSSSSALLAAGSVVEVSLRVARGDLRAGAAVVRPPGHHAEADAAMGFCLFNNVAVAAHVLVHGNRDLGVQKVLIVDWDVHHGNGTQHMFWKDPQVLYFSLHRFDFGTFYPGGNGGDSDKVGEGSGAGFNINVPWPFEGFGDLDYLAVFDHVLMPVAREFKPDLVLVSGGFDSATGDPLGGCEVTPAGYSQMINRLMGLANGRLVLALEGGYNLTSISESYLACMKVLLGDQPEKVISTKHHISSTVELVKEVRGQLQQYWSVLSTKVEADSIINVEGVARPKKAKEAEDVLADSKLFDIRDEVNRVVETFSNSLSLDSEADEVPRGSLVDNALIETKHAHAEEKSGLGGVQAAGTAKVSISEVGSSPLEEPKISTQEATETASRTAITRDHNQVNGMDGDAEHRSKEGNMGNYQEIRISAGGTELQDGDKLESSSLAADSVSSPDHLDAERDHVWYACYASNLWEARFMCYINGGQVEGMGRACLGSRNQTPPVASRWIMVPYNLFFGHSWTSTWGSGGVAFLDPVSHGGAPNTHVRLYKITLQQLCDLLIQENKGDPNNSEVLIEWDHINKLRDVQSATFHATLDFLKDEAWYGTIKYLGDEDGLPMLTVTCSVEYVRRFRERQFQVCPPSERYSKVILRGLLEHGTWSEEECKAYLASKSNGLPEDSNDEKI